VQGVIGGPSVTFNPYPYAQNNPVNMVDPNGEFALPVAIALLASTWAWNREVTANRAKGLTGWDAFSIDNVNIRPIIEPWAMLGAGYVGGAAIGALGLTGRTAFAAGAVTDIGASYLWNTQVNGSYSATDLLFDAAFFGMGEYIGYRGVLNAGSSSYSPSPQDFRQARNIIGARRAEAIGGGRLDIRMSLMFPELGPQPRLPNAPDVHIRAVQIAENLNEITRRKVTIGVGDVRDPETGNIYRLVSSSETNRLTSRIDRGVFESQNEWIVPHQRRFYQSDPAPNVGHAEYNIIRYAERKKWEVLEVGASRAICPDCADDIRGAGGSPIGPLRGKS